jgi:hypothetical protein
MKNLGGDGGVNGLGGTTGQDFYYHPFISSLYATPNKKNEE